MKQTVFDKTTFLVVTTALIAINLVSLFLLYNLDQIVHGDLYNYGLTFNYAWANNYWINLDALVIAIVIPLILASICFILLYRYDLKKNKIALTASTALYLALGYTAIISIFLLTKINTIISIDLAQYGVEYSYFWTQKYHLFSRTLVGLKIASITICSSLSTWALLTLYKPKRTITKLISIISLIAGTKTFLASALLQTAIGITAGLGLILTGLITGYITSQKYVKQEIFTTQLTTTYRYLEKFLQNPKKTKKALYIPQELQTKDNAVIILENQEENDLIKNNLNPKKLLVGTKTLIPPGNQLVQLFENILDTNFAKTNLSFLSTNLPKIIIDQLEIATSFHMENHNDTVQIQFENSIFNNLIFNQQFSETLNNVGCPLSSAIACAISKATGKYAIITKYQIDKQTKTNTVNYQLI